LKLGKEILFGLLRVFMSSLLSQSGSTHSYFISALKSTPTTVATKEYNYSH